MRASRKILKNLDPDLPYLGRGNLADLYASSLTPEAAKLLGLTFDKHLVRHRQGLRDMRSIPRVDEVARQAAIWDALRELGVDCNILRDSQDMLWFEMIKQVMES